MVRLDPEDRDFAILWGIRIAGGGLVALSGAAIAGLAWRVFWLAAG